MTATVADIVMRLVQAGAGPIVAAGAVAEAFALGASSVTALPVTLPITLPQPLPKERSRKAVNQAAYRLRMKENQGKGVAMAANPTAVTPPATPLPTVTASVTSAPLSILPFLSSSQGIQEEKKEVLVTEPRAKAKRQRGGGTRMTEDWYPDDKGMKKAVARGLRLVEIEIEITKFRNYWINRTDRDSSKPRWDLAWENWLLNAKGTLNAGANGHRPNSNSGSAQTHGDAVMAGMANYAARRRQGQPAAARGTVCGRDDAAAEPHADGRAAGGDREPPRQLAFMPRTDVGK